VKGLLATPRWSPDGKAIAVLFTENATRAAGPLVAETPETGEIKDAFFEQRLALVDLAHGEFRQISPRTCMSTNTPGRRTARAWPSLPRTAMATTTGISPSSTRLDAVSRPHEVHPQTAAANRESGVVSDGKRIAFIAGLMSDEHP